MTAPVGILAVCASCCAMAPADEFGGRYVKGAESVFKTVSIAPTEELKKFTSAKSQDIVKAWRPNVTLTVATRADLPDPVLVLTGPASHVQSVEPLSASFETRKPK